MKFSKILDKEQDNYIQRRLTITRMMNRFQRNVHGDRNYLSVTLSKLKFNTQFLVIQKCAYESDQVTLSSAYMQLVRKLVLGKDKEIDS